MNFRVNGEQREIADNDLTVEKVLNSEKVKNPDMVAVQFNGEFLPKDRFGTTPVKDGDEVDFVYFMGGGEGRI